SQFGSDETRLALRPTACFANNLDVDDDLKGWSLYALWPGNINALDVLACLTPPKRENYLGGYGSFIYRFADTLDENFPLASLPEAIKWAMISGTESSKLSHISDAIVLLAFQNIETADVAEALAEFVISRIMKHQEVIANFGALTKKGRFREVLQ